MSDLLDDPEELTQDDYLALVEEIAAKKRTQTEVARALGLTRQAVSRWVAAYKETGRIPVVGKRRPRKGELRPFEDLRIKKLVEDHTPAGLGIEGGGEVWTASCVQSLVTREYDRDLSEKACAKILEGCRPKGFEHPREHSKPKAPHGEAAAQKASEAELEEMRDKICEGQAKLADAGAFFPRQKTAPHGVRTGKHAQGSAKKGKRKKSPRKKSR